MPAPRPSDAELLGTLGIDLDAVRRDTEHAFGVQVVGEATWRVTRRRWLVGPSGWCGRRCVARRWSPSGPCGWPASRPKRWAMTRSGPSICSWASWMMPRQPADIARGSRRHRQITAHVGLPDGYQGAAGLLLAALGVDLDQLRDAVATEVGGVQR